MKTPLALLLTAFLLLSLNANANDDGPTLPENARAIVIRCTIFNDTLNLNGTASDQIVFIGGEIRVDYIYLVSVRVMLSGSCDKGWSVPVFPSEMTFTTSSVQGFWCNLTVPANTYNISATVAVRADATISSIPADTSNDNCTITVGPPSDNPPVIPPVKPPAGKKNGTAPMDMPVLMSALAVAAVVSTAAVLWVRKSARVPRDVKGNAGKPGTVKENKGAPTSRKKSREVFEIEDEGKNDD